MVRLFQAYYEQRSDKPLWRSYPEKLMKQVYEKEFRMKMTRYIIQISIDVPDTFTEVIPDDVESMEVAVEGGISPILAELFGGTILVEKVLIHSLELMQTPVH